MKAAVIAEPGNAPAYADFAEPAVGEGFELVELVATGIHPIVRSLARGTHYGSAGSYPMIPGVDAVASTADGTLIYTGYVRAPYGTIAERMAVPAGMRFELPDGADPNAIAAGLNPGLASWMPLRARTDEVGRLGTVLILGATGMAGLLAVQNAFAIGADRVVACGRDSEALSVAAGYGATAVQLTASADENASSIRSALGPDAPALVLDFVWGAVAEAAFSALSRGGLDEDSADIAYVEIGALAGPDAKVPASLLRSRRIRLTGSGAGSGSTAQIMAQLGAYMDLIADGRVEVPVTTYPLSRVAEAWEANTGRSRAVIIP